MTTEQPQAGADSTPVPAQPTGEPEPSRPGGGPEPGGGSDAARPAGGAGLDAGGTSGRSGAEIASSAGGGKSGATGSPGMTKTSSADPPGTTTASGPGSAGVTAPSGPGSTAIRPATGPSSTGAEAAAPGGGPGRRWWRRKAKPAGAPPAREAVPAAVGAPAAAGAIEAPGAAPTTPSTGAKAAADQAASTAGTKDPGSPAEPGGGDPQGTGEPTRGRRRRKKIPTTRPPGSPPDPWTAFAAESERPPGRIRRGLRAVGRSFVHEYALVTYAGLLLAVALTWPTLRYPMHTVPQDIWDPARQAWQVSWSGHILLTEPVRLWQSNAFFPERYSFAFGNSLLGYAPAGMLGEGPFAAVLRYNILFVLAHALLFIGGYALVRQLGAGRTGAAVAAVAFAYAPWRLAQAGHLDIISAGGIPLALAMLARGHGWSIRHGLRPGRRHAGWAALGWMVAAWQISLGFSLGLPFAYVLGGILLVMIVAAPIRWWRKRAQRPVLGWRLLITDLLGVLILSGIGALIALPYLRAADVASTAEIRFFSPPVHSLLIAPAESRIWGAAHAVPRASLGWPAEMTLLPGFVLYALALVGLVFSIWKWWQRLLLLLGAVAAAILTLGTTFFDGRWTYLPLFGHLPQSFGVRIPGRLMLWVTLLLAILAAGAVAELVRRAEHLSAHRIPPWPGPWLRLATFVPVMLVLAEGWNATQHPVMPTQPAAMRTVTGPMLVLPTSPLQDQTVMLWSTTRFQPIANGSGFAADRQAALRQSVMTFPDAASVQYLRSLGVSTVLLLRAQVAGTPWERAGDVPVDALGIRREDLNDAVIFHLS